MIGEPSCRASHRSRENLTRLWLIHRSLAECLGIAAVIASLVIVIAFWLPVASIGFGAALLAVLGLAYEHLRRPINAIFGGSMVNVGDQLSGRSRNGRPVDGVLIDMSLRSVRVITPWVEEGARAQRFDAADLQDGAVMPRAYVGCGRTCQRVIPDCARELARIHRNS